MIIRNVLLMAFILTVSFALPSYAEANLNVVRYATEKVDGLDIFYRESGDPSKQAVVLLHGFPHSSHQYRELLANLGDEQETIKEVKDLTGLLNVRF